MPSAWEKEERRQWTRREWVKASLLAGVAGAAGLAAGVGVSTLLSPPARPSSIVDERLVYTSFPTKVWWSQLVGQPVMVTDLAPWAGATAVWRGVFTDGRLEIGTGFPVLVVRIPSDTPYLQVPSGSWSLPSGYDLYYEDLSRDLRIVVFLARCTDLCCYVGWHVVTNPPPGHDYANYGLEPPYPPTYEVYGQDPIYCVCHGAQFDPLLLVASTNPANNVTFPGAELIYGPGRFALPIIPVRAVKDVLEGGMADPRWYGYC